MDEVKQKTKRIPVHNSPTQDFGDLVLQFQMDETGFFRIVCREKEDDRIEETGFWARYEGIATLHYGDHYFVAFSGYWEGGVPVVERVLELKELK